MIGRIHIDDSLHILEDRPRVLGRLPKEKIIHVMQDELQRLILDCTLHLLKDFLESGEMLSHSWI